VRGRPAPPAQEGVCGATRIVSGSGVGSYSSLAPRNVGPGGEYCLEASVLKEVYSTEPALSMREHVE
jgi:hypothetical protein